MEELRGVLTSQESALQDVSREKAQVEEMLKVAAHGRELVERENASLEVALRESKIQGEGYLRENQDLQVIRMGGVCL
jgi:hypothetical protein